MSNEFQPKSYRSDIEVEFTFPKGLQDDTGIKTITIRELPGSAESRAIARAGNDGGVLMQELVKEGLVRALLVDGTVVEISTGDESVDRIMSQLGSKGRALALQAYSNVNQPSKEDAASFLQSASAKVR